MDVENFTREVKPHHKRSKLTQFEQQIRELKNQGYSDMQVRDWLERSGITVSRQNVQKYIARHLKSQGMEPSPAIIDDTPKELATRQVSTVGLQPGTSRNIEDTKESPAARLQRLAMEQRDEAAKNHFSHDKTGNNH